MPGFISTSKIGGDTLGESEIVKVVPALHLGTQFKYAAWSMTAGKGHSTPKGHKETKAWIENLYFYDTLFFFILSFNMKC